MVSEDLLIGNLAIAALVIKTVISTFKQMFTIKKEYIQIATIVLGVGAAFALNANLIEVAEPTKSMIFLQKLFSGLFIGATSMGVHETTKAITKHVN